MKCSSLNITERDRFELVAGLPVRTDSKRPSVLVGRTYKVGNLFQSFDESIGVEVPLSDALIRSPQSINLDRLIEGTYRLDSQAGSKATGVIDVDTGSDGEGHLLQLCVQGYRDLRFQFNMPAVDMLCEVDATLHSAYFVDRARAYLLLLKPGARVVVSFGVVKKVVNTIQGDKWWQLSHWFPYETEDRIIQYHDLEVTLVDGEVICQILNS